MLPRINLLIKDLYELPTNIHVKFSNMILLYIFFKQKCKDEL